MEQRKLCSFRCSLKGHVKAECNTHREDETTEEESPVAVTTLPNEELTRAKSKEKAGPPLGKQRKNTPTKDITKRKRGRELYGRNGKQ